MTTRTILAILAIMLLCVGCAPTARDVVEQAARRWQRAIGIPCDMPAFVVGRDEVFSCGPSVPSAAGCYHRTEDLIELNMRLDLREVVAVHEYGHRLGDGTHGPNGTIMAREVGSGSLCITRADVEKVCALAACRWERPECP